MPDSRLTRPPIAADLSDETLEEINRLWTIARAFANTAHEVNNALQAISGNAELLGTKELDPVTLRRVSSIGAEANRASTLIHTLQAYARAERDATPLIDLRLVVVKAVGLRTASLRRERIVVEQAVPDNAVLVAAPGSRLLQILLNLLLEAERALHGAKSAKITLRIDTRPGESAVVVHASAAEWQATDASAGERPLGGLTDGAQLWVARYLAEQAGGNVAVTSATGERDWTLTLPGPATITP